jgi:hypothetical protein
MPHHPSHTPHFHRAWRLLAACALLLAAARSPAAAHLRGNLGAHDPSTIIQCQDRYYLFATGTGIASRWSTNKLFWSAGPTIFTNAPAWTTNAAPGFDGTFWAPDIIVLNGRYCLYYSVSSWGSQVSAIGLVTNPTLDPTDPAYRWTDQGIVIQSTNGSPYNTIDPSVTRDAAGNPWLAFGSYWNGIYVVQLDPLTGLRLAPNSPVTRLAWNHSIEAACLHRRGAYYYLFVNWGSCCDGVNSTYHIRVGRSPSITGPFLDRNGVDLRNGGGTLFLEGTGKFTGPGHVGILSEGGKDWFSYHYYDAGAYAPWYGAFGAANFDLQPLAWTADGWPAFTNDWSAGYRFQADARDDGGQYYGLLRGGAVVTNDATRGRGLRLAGAGQAVHLPPGVAFARTFAAVVKWDGGNAWQRIFDFGTDTSRYVMLTPAAGNGRLTCHLKTGGAVQALEASSALPVGVWTHVAVTLDGARGVLYRNGVPVATNAGMNYSPLEVRAQTNFLGRSKFAADPDFRGQFASFRVWGRALSAAEIAAPHPLIHSPAEGAPTWPGQEVAFSGGATDFMEMPLPASALTWRVEFVRDNGVTNLVLGPLAGVTNGAFTVSTNPAFTTNGCYRVRLTATDGAGRSATRTLELARVTATAQPEWASFYPFTSGAQDASNRWPGTLVGGASVQNDAERGPAARLAGGSQCVSLPAGAGALRTISAWVKWNGGADWQRVFDLGANTQRWFMLTPRDGEGRLQVAISTQRSSYVYVLQAPTALPTNIWTHMAVVLDGRQAILYLNGEAAVVHNGVYLLPADVAPANFWLGRSQYPADANFNGWLDSVRLHSRALTPEELFAPWPVLVQPAVNRLFAGGEQVVFAGSATDYRDAALPPSAFRWDVDFRHGGSNAPFAGPVTNVTGGFFTTATEGPPGTNVAYRVNFTVTDAAGRAATVSREVPPRVATLSLDTVPSGLGVALDGQPLSTPVVLPQVAGWTRTVSAPLSQIYAGSNYNFVLWSDSGLATHSFSMPLTHAILTASYVEPSLTLRPLGDEAGGGINLSWPAWAAPLALHATTNLTPPVVWNVVTNVPELATGQYRLRLPATQNEAFFRLQDR